MTDSVAMPDTGAPAAAQERAGFARWWMVAVLTSLSILSMVDRQIFALLMEPIRHELNLSSFEIGLLHGVAFAFFFAVFGLVFGWATDNFDRRRVVCIGVTIWSAASSACGVVTNFAQLAVARFAVGAGEASLGPAAFSMIADGFPRNRLSFALGVYGTGAIIGAAASLVLGGGLAAIIPPEGLTLPLLGLTPQWRIIFLLTGVPGFILAFLILMVQEPARQARVIGTTDDDNAAKAFVRSRWMFFTSYVTGVALLSAGGLGLLAWMASHLMRKFGLSLTEVGFMLGPIQLVPGLVGLLCSGMMSDWLYARGKHDAGPRILVVLASLQLIPAVIIALADTVWLDLLAVAVYMLCATGTASLGPSAVQLVTPSNFRGRVAAIYKLWTHTIGLTFGPALVGFLVTYVYGEGPTVGYGIATVILVLNPIAIVLFLVAMRAMRKLAAA